MSTNGVSSASSHVIVISEDPNPLPAGDSDGATNVEKLEPTQDEEEAIYMMQKMVDDSSICRRRALSEDCCIFRVPERLKHDNVAAFVPSVISIGPFHHTSDGMRSMEEQKWVYLNSLLSNHCFNGRIGLRELFCAVAPLEEKIRRSYSENITVTRIRLMEMMVLDGCFIIEFFLRLNTKFRDKDHLPKPWFITEVKRDLLKLENQIPFFVLETLYHNLTSSSSSKLPHLTTLALRVLRFPLKNDKEPDAFTGMEVKHLLDLYCLGLRPRSSLPESTSTKLPTGRNQKQSSSSPETSQMELPTGQNQKQSSSSPESSQIKLPAGQNRKQSSLPSLKSSPKKLPTAHKQERSSPEWIFSAHKFQQAAAIAFEAGDPSDSLLDIKFIKRSGTIKIPVLKVDNFTKLVFFNGLAFEQAYMHRARYMTSYVHFMGALIHNLEDVHILRRCGVICNHLGTDKEVVRVFNGMRKDMIILPGCRYLIPVFRGVEEFRGTKRAKLYSFWAELWETYFRSPWALISFLGALAAFMLTALQTHYTLHPNN